MLITADSPDCQDCDNVCLGGGGRRGREMQTDWVEQGGEKCKKFENGIQKYTLATER